MRKIPVEEAIGQTLCHDLTAILEGGFKGVKFKRGHVIAETDIPELLNMGKYYVFVWDPAADEVHEDDAARALAESLCDASIRYTGPVEGKFQFTAAQDGLFVVNRQALRAINSVEDYTVATRPGYTAVREGEKLAGARIVPLVTKRANVEAAVQIAKENSPVLSVRPFLPLKTGVIITGNEVYYGRIQDRFEPVMRKKLPTYGAEILGVVKCPDDLDRISAAVDGFLAQGAELILLTGGMSVDPDDLTPTAIRRTGAKLVTQGVPMQPGNMLMIAYLDKTALVGVPGASLHSPVTSLDVFLPRIFAGLAIQPEDIAAFGEGGFCMACETCTYPICYFGRT